MLNFLFFMMVSSQFLSKSYLCGPFYLFKPEELPFLKKLTVNKVFFLINIGINKTIHRIKPRLCNGLAQYIPIASYCIIIPDFTYVKHLHFAYDKLDDNCYYPTSFYNLIMSIELHLSCQFLKTKQRLSILLTILTETSNKFIII